MAWLRIDDRVRTHPKIVAAGPDAAWVWFSGICYCREHLTDGFIPNGMLATLVPGVLIRKIGRAVAKLVEERLWHVADGGYTVHDFLDWNPSRADVLAKRVEDLDRKKKKFQPDSTTDSTRIPSGTTTDSTTDSTRKVDGFRADSLPARARAAGAIAHGSGLGSSPGSFGGDVRGTAPNPRRFDRQHAGHLHGFCAFKCLSEEKVQKFAQDLPRGADDPRNFDRVLAWAENMRDTWGDKPKLELDWWTFWEARWKEYTPTLADKSYADELMAEGEARRAFIRKATGQ